MYQKALACRRFQSGVIWFLAWFLCCLQYADTAAQPCSVSSEGRRGLGREPDPPCSLHIFCRRRVGARRVCLSGVQELEHCSSLRDRQPCFSSGGEVGS